MSECVEMDGKGKRGGKRNGPSICGFLSVLFPRASKSDYTCIMIHRQIGRYMDNAPGCHTFVQKIPPCNG